MMAGTAHNPGYRALAMSQIMEIKEDGAVKILLEDETEIVIKVTKIIQIVLTLSTCFPRQQSNRKIMLMQL